MGLLKALSRLADWSRLRQWSERRHGPQALDTAMRALQGWQRTPLARAILSEQQEQLDSLLSGLFGYHLLEMSCLQTPALSANSRIGHRFRLAPLAGYGEQARALYEALPLESESIDVVILHHILEYSSNPHQVLREANRVLIARGHLLIVGFNPWSLQGLYKSLAQWLGAGAFWRRRSLRAGRVADWLQLLDCEPVAMHRGFFRLPVNHAGLLRRTVFWERFCRHLKLPFGGYYILLARKDRVCMTPIKPSWGKVNPVAGLVMGKPTSRLSGQAGRARNRPATAAPEHPNRTTQPDTRVISE